jgi:hypothetical protein
LVNCNSRNAIDCLQTSGAIIETQVTVLDFYKILVRKQIRLYIKQGAQQLVTLETGENLLPAIDLKLVDNQLQIITTII